MNNQNSQLKSKNSNISRKEAIGKMGKYAALTAIGTFTILNPTHSQVTSLPPTGADNPFSDLNG